MVKLMLFLHLAFFLLPFLIARVAYPIDVTVTSGQGLGPVSPLFRLGGNMWWSTNVPPFAYDMILRDQKKLGLLRYSLEFPLACRFADCQNVDHVLARIKNDIANGTDPRQWKSKGGEILVLIPSIPEYLSSCSSRYPFPLYPSDLCQRNMNEVTGYNEPLWAQMPPGNSIGFRELIHRIVLYFNTELRLDARFELWNEPHYTFMGTEKDFKNMYKDFVAGAQGEKASARVGAPGGAGWRERKWNNVYNTLTQMWDSSQASEPMLQSFISYASQAHLQLDFVAIHNYGTLPNNYTQQVQEVRSWLSAGGFRNTEVIDDEWNSTFGGDLYTETEFSASFVASTLIAMEKAGLSQHSFSGFFDAWGCTTPAVYTNTLITCDYIIKPSFNAFKLFGELSGQEIPVSVGGSC